MTGRERFINTMKFSRVDRPFRWEAPHFWTQTFTRWYGEGLPRDITIETIFDYFGMDRLEWLPVEGSWTGTPYCPMFEQTVIEEQEENVIRLEQDGIIKKQRTDNWDSSMPQFLEFPVKTRRDFEEKIRWRLDPNTKERLPENWDVVKKEYNRRDYPLGMFVIGVFGHPRNLMGDDSLMYALYDDPHLIHTILEQWLYFYKGYIDLVCKDVVPDFILVWEDMCYKNGPLISPASFREFMAPYLKKLIHHINTKGIDIILLDTDGNMWELIDIFLECGVNAFYPFEVGAGMDVRKVRKEYPNSFGMIGGLDKKALSIDKAAIVTELESKIPQILAQGGWIPSLDHSAPPNIPLNLFTFYIEKLREMGERYV